MSRDLEQLLHDTAAEPTRDVDPAGIVARAQRRTWMTRAAVSIVAGLAVVGAVLGAQQVLDTSEPPEIVEQPDAPTAESGWRQLPGAPLEPRHDAHTVAVDGRLLVVGGTSADPCPPGASCVGPDQAPHQDGAMYDPTTGEWIDIAQAPVPVGSGSAVVHDGSLYLLVSATNLRGGSSTGAAFLAYHPGDDRWEQLPYPPGGGLQLAPFADRIVAYRGTQEAQVEPDLVYDPTEGAWSELPTDPLVPSYDRTMVWTGDRLVLIAPEAVDQPGSEEPSLYRAAALEPDTGEWQRLPDSEVSAGRPHWAHLDGEIVNPSIGTADGGMTNNWGRSYPYGGILDPSGDQWRALPDPPAEEGQFGIRTTAPGETRVTAFGWVFDAATQRWTRLPVPDDGPDAGHTGAWIDDELYVFGGFQWTDDHRDGHQLNAVWAWTPPSRGGSQTPGTHASLPAPSQLEPAAGSRRLTDEQVNRAVELAAQEPATSQILAQHDIADVDVQAGPEAQLGDTSTWVAFMFPEPTEPDVDPYTEMCAIGGQTDQWLGVVVRVDIDGGNAASSSPIWTTGADCASWSGLDQIPDVPLPPGEKTSPETPPCLDDPDSVVVDSATVAVYLRCGIAIDIVKPRTRSVEAGTLEDRLAGAIQHLAQGPSPQERDRGYGDTFPGGPSLLTGTAFALDTGTVTVSFDPEIRNVPGLGAASTTQPFIEGLEATVLQFDEVDTLRLEIDGDCWTIDPYGTCTFTRD